MSAAASENPTDVSSDTNPNSHVLEWNINSSCKMLLGSVTLTTQSEVSG